MQWLATTTDTGAASNCRCASAISAAICSSLSSTSGSGAGAADGSSRPTGRSPLGVQIVPMLLP